MKMPIIDMKGTGSNLKRIRCSRGYTVKQLQRVLGLCSLQAIYAWESGKSCPGLDNLLCLVELYGVPVEELIVVK